MNATIPLPLETSPQQKTKRAPRRHLTGIEFYRLTQYLLEHYASSKLNDKQFAEHASEELKIAGINDNHVIRIRTDFEIPANVTRVSRGAVQNIQVFDSRLEALEGRIAVLETKMRRLEAGKIS